MLEARRVSAAALLLLPGGLVSYFAFHSGGFYPGPSAYVAMLLCLVLAVRVMAAQTPFAGLSPSLLVAVGSLALYSVWTLVSGAWSHAPGEARVEFDLPLVYALAMLLLGSVQRTRSRLKWVLRSLAVASTIVCTCGLITRLLPHLWPTSPEIANNRLSFPVTYWNVLGLVAALGIVLCLHFSSELHEPGPRRVVAAAAIPILATTLYFTFSRGAIASCVIAVLAYVLIGRPRGILSSLVAIVPPTAVAIKDAYGANLLATPDPTTAGAVVQGHRVAIAVVGCVLGAALLRTVLVFSLDRGLRGFALPPQLRRRTARTAWASLATITLVAVVALNGTLSNEYHRFVHPTAGSNPQDLRARLTDPSNNGRLEYWRVAWQQFKTRPLAGQGAGTYQEAWTKYRRVDYPVLDAHSLYLETLGELGIVGLALLLTTIVTVLVRVVARARGSGRALYAAVFAVLLAYAIHAGVDWDWEMPVVTIIFFALGGFALARRPHEPAHSASRAPVGTRWRGGWAIRSALAAACILVGLLPGYVWLSQRKLDAASYAFSQGDCVTARGDALSAISILGNRAEPYELASYCDLRLGMNQAALAAMNKAVSLDPNNWNYRYGLVLMRAATGLDPRQAAREALALNPRDSDVQEAWQTFGLGKPAQWKAQATSLADSFDAL